MPTVVLDDIDAPGRLPLEARAGGQLVFDADFYDDEAATVEHDFTLEAGLWLVRTRRDPDAPEITRATFDDLRLSHSAVSPAPTSPSGAGRLSLRIPASTTADWTPGCYWYWLSFWPAGNSDAEDYWLEGPLTVSAGNGT